MRENLPLVSIVIPVYNGSNYMREAIDSALNQTYPRIEVLVINDGSTDDGATAEVARSYGDRIRYFEKPNGGVSTALNYGIHKMKGAYFSWLSHDDVYDVHKVERQVNLLDGAEKTLALCRSDLIDEHSDLIRENHRSDSAETSLNWKGALMRTIRRCPGGCSFLIPREVFDTCGMFNEELRYCQDVLMGWTIFLHVYSLRCSAETDVHYRIHSQRVTVTSSHLFSKDAEKISHIVMPKFAEKSDRAYNFLFEYAKGEAVHGNSSIVKRAIAAARERSLFSAVQICRLHTLNLYGSVRPALRNLYYRIRKKG